MAPRPLNNYEQKTLKQVIRFGGTSWYINNNGVCHLSALLAAMDACLKLSSFGRRSLQDPPEHGDLTLLGRILLAVRERGTSTNASNLHTTIINKLLETIDRWTSFNLCLDLLNILRISYQCGQVYTSLQFIL